jgi:hypothetical protein
MLLMGSSQTGNYFTLLHVSSHIHDARRFDAISLNPVVCCP